MLKKECCQKCWRKVIKKRGWEIDGWIKDNKKNWHMEGIYCPDDGLEAEEKSYRKITEEPPSKCPYYLEHII